MFVSPTLVELDSMNRVLSEDQKAITMMEEYYKHKRTYRLRCDYMGYIRGQYMRVLG